MAQEAALSLADIDLNNVDQFVECDIHAVWRLLRAEAPIFWSEGTDEYPGFWSITKYADILAISRDPETFMSGQGSTFTTNPKNPPLTLGKILLHMDPPRHVRVRRLVNKGFTPRMVGRLEPQIRQIAESIFAIVTPLGRCDFVTSVAARLPLAVICGMLGAPHEDWDLLFDLANRFIGQDDPEYQTRAGDREATRRRATQEIASYFSRLLAERRREPGDDLVSVLAEEQEEALTEEEVLFLCLLLLNAGSETTRNAISGGMLALIEYPEQRRLLVADSALMPTAIEEILRWTSPVQHMMRTTTRDVEIRGRKIQGGERVVMWYSSANRDEEVFSEPDRFDVRRTPNEHLAFGVGEHFCLGAGLARLELRVMFEELLQHLPDVELDGPIERLRSNAFNGIKRMPVRFTARSHGWRRGHAAGV